MKLKKVNSILGFILSVLLVIHLVSMSCLLIGAPFSKIFAIIGRAMSVITLAHVIISIRILSKTNDGKGGNAYFELNKTTFIQRISGMLIILLLVFHIKALSFMKSGEEINTFKKVYVLIIEGVFFYMSCCHLSISFTKMLLSLGLTKDEKTYKIANSTCICVCMLLLIFSLLSLVVFIIGY